MGGGGGGFRAATSDTYGSASVKKLTSSIAEDKEIDEESRAELIAALDSKKRVGGNGTFVAGKDYRTVSSNLDKAREGTDPLYATRRLFQNRRQSVLAQPGRAQTVMTR